MKSYSSGFTGIDEHIQGSAMSYKTILVHADKSAHTAARIALAARIAIAEDAHLIGAAMTGLSRFAHPHGSIASPDTPFPFDLSVLHDRVKQALAAFTAQVEHLGVRSFEARLVDDDAEGGLVVQARYADLMIVGQADPHENQPSLIDELPQYVMLNTPRPVLIVPYAGQFADLGKTPLLAWDGSQSATRAITAAIPLLKRADQVTLVVFNPDAAYDCHGEQPGADMALFLARHGVYVDVVQHETALDIGDALLNLSGELQSDLLVMGGYGHRRWRELILGGATRTVLQSMTLPVLMSH
jgi:nucleotide-binding universal stress UspA family protein